ncbi:aldehyde dehydrogenase family protein [Microbacterium maritypicum]|uniref:aldehyde dehydrogenase family protein n=1 Tax=Microbacterium maritypicum TaxID=33918 RepID=UPI0037F7E23B
MTTPTLVGTRHEGLLIGGERIAATADATFENISPVTGASFATMAAATPADAIRAVEAAQRAFADWADRSFVERRAVLLRAADILESEYEAVRELLALETGAVAPWAAMNVHESAATLREAAGLASSPVGELLPSANPATLNLSLRRPAGVVLAIVPWNAPIILSARSTAIALALGNTVVLRPSEESPISSGHLLASALERAGAPAGVVNVVTTAPGGGRGAINAMIEHPAVSRVVFIGSTQVGRSIAAVAGSALTPVVMELGGKNSTIVRHDADLDRWVPRLAFAAFANAGQVCMCSERIVAHSSIADELTDRLAAFADGMLVGDPRDASTELGPVINARAAAAFGEFIEDAKANGATVRAGGTIEGSLARPTVLTGVTRACRFYGEESFLPIVSITSVQDDEEALERANEGGYGLIGGVASADEGTAERIATRMHAGAVHVNGPSIGDEPHVPFGGVGASGFGRLGGGDSVRFFTQQQTLYRHPAR